MEAVLLLCTFPDECALESGVAEMLAGGIETTVGPLLTNVFGSRSCFVN